MSLTVKTTETVDGHALQEHTGWHMVVRHSRSGPTEIEVLTEGVRASQVETAVAEHLSARDTRQRNADQATVDAVDALATADLDDLRAHVVAREKERVAYDEARARLDANGGRG